jgi:hypothetical protein
VEGRNYRKEIWMLLHNSESSENETAAVRLYLDESGSKDPGTPQALVAGLLINYSHFLAFEGFVGSDVGEAWDHRATAHEGFCEA